MTAKQTITNLNRLTREEFTNLLGGIFEHSPWVAELAFEQIPFDSLEALHQTMSGIVQASSMDKRLALIRNHPELAGQEADEDRLTADSKKEQSGAGLNQCSAEELDLLHHLNRSYLQKFEFPFVVAVTGLNKHQIIASLQKRLDNNQDDEFATSIYEICKIGKIRLNGLIDG